MLQRSVNSPFAARGDCLARIHACAMLAVASPPPPPLQLNHDHPGSPIFGPLKPTNGALNNSLDELLKHPLEFKQGCLTPSSGVLTAGIAEGKYKPINDEPMSEVRRLNYYCWPGS